MGMGMGMGMGSGMGMGMGMDMDMDKDMGKHKLRRSSLSDGVELARHKTHVDTQHSESKPQPVQHRHAASNMTNNSTDAFKMPDSDEESDGTTQELVEMTDKWNSGKFDEVAEQLEGMSVKIQKDSLGISRDMEDNIVDSPTQSTAKSAFSDNATVTAKSGAKGHANGSHVKAQVVNDMEKKSKKRMLHEERGVDNLDFENHLATATNQPIEKPSEAEQAFGEQANVEGLSVADMFGNTQSDVNVLSPEKNNAAAGSAVTDSPTISGASSMQEHMAEVLGRMRAKQVASVSHDVEANHVEPVEVEKMLHSTKHSSASIDNSGSVEETYAVIAKGVNDTGRVNAQEAPLKVVSNQSSVDRSKDEAQQLSHEGKGKIQNTSSPKTILAKSAKTSAISGGSLDKVEVEHEKLEGNGTSDSVEPASEQKYITGQAALQNRTRANRTKTSFEIPIDDKLPRKGLAPNELDATKLAWLHVPKTGTSFANTLASWACTDLAESDFAGNGEDGGNDALLGNFMEHHGHQCKEGFSLCNGHSPISRDSCNDWDAHEGHFVGMFREPEQRIIAGYNQNCHDVPGRDHTLRSYAEMVAGCSVKMLNGQECGANITVTSDMVKHGIRRIEEGFAFAGLTEEWALSVCLFHTMYGGKCHPREFVDVRPGLMHRDMPYDISELDGWVDPFDGALYAHASTVFWDNIAKYGVSPDMCKRTVCSSTPDEFKLSVLRQR